MIGNCVIFIRPFWPAVTEGNRFQFMLKWALYVFTVTFVLLAGGQGTAWAVQTHGGTEGLVAHQIGHVLFVLGMTYLLVRIRSMKLPGAGWLEFKTFLWLILFWNVMTFTGHWLDEYVSGEQFVRSGGGVTFHLESFADLVYYLSRFDHLALVPAFVFLLLALRKWAVQQ